MVFQHFNLFPHMTALENVTCAPIHVKGAPARAGAPRGARAARPRRPRGQGRQLPRAALRRAAAARGDRARAGDGAEADAVRRADLGARPRARRRGARGDAAARTRRHDDDRRDARDGLRARRSPTASCSWTTASSSRRAPRTRCSAGRVTSARAPSCRRSSSRPGGSPRASAEVVVEALERVREIGAAEARSAHGEAPRRRSPAAAARRCARRSARTSAPRRARPTCARSRSGRRSGAPTRRSRRGAR